MTRKRTRQSSNTHAPQEHRQTVGEVFEEYCRETGAKMYEMYQKMGQDKGEFIEWEKKTYGFTGKTASKLMKLHLGKIPVSEINPIEVNLMMGLDSDGDKYREATLADIGRIMLQIEGVNNEKALYEEMCDKYGDAVEYGINKAEEFLKPHLDKAWARIAELEKQLHPDEEVEDNPIEVDWA